MPIAKKEASPGLSYVAAYVAAYPPGAGLEHGKETAKEAPAVNRFGRM